MENLDALQAALIFLIFVWSGFVRSGLGFGGAVLSLPFLLLVHDEPLYYLPIISIQLLVFSSITILRNNRRRKPAYSNSEEAATTAPSSVNWQYLKYAMGIMIVPKLVGVAGVIALPADLMTGVVFCIVVVYSISYILNKPFASNSPALDVIFLILGGYVSGTSLIGAPLIIAVFAKHVAVAQLRDTLFALWFILVAIKLTAFVYVGVDLQLRQQLWLLPAATIGHLLGLRFHDYTLRADTRVFYRIIGITLLCISLVGLYRMIL